MGAPNPWHDSLPPLDPSSVLLEGENPLEIIRELLLRWPGEATVKQKDRVRHERLIQIIAGYPKIDFGRFPLDWLLNPLSIKAMRLSRFLDSLPSPDGSEKSSLRSALLNKSMHIDSYFYENIKSGHKRVLGLLFSELRNFYSDDSEGFNPDELRLLSSLHSSEKLDWWPIEEFRYLNDENKHIKNIRTGMCEGWKDDTDLALNVNEGQIWGIKFNKIQSWIVMCSGEIYCEELGDYTHENPIGPRLIRGSSAILESILSSIRHHIVRNFGVHSIVVDGGGRIEFISSQVNPKPIIEKAIKDSLHVSEEYTPYFNSEIDHLFELYDNEYEGSCETYGEYLSLNFPPHTIYQKDNYKESEEEFELYRSKHCIFCDENKKVNSQDIGSKWDRFFEDIGTSCCDFHRLLYFSGRAQRLIDSSVRERGKPISLVGKQRDILGISRLDLNSLGALFRSKFSSSNEENDLEIVRRRSFRFNSQWWEIVQSVVDNPAYEVDRIAAWMAAGDDIIIAENNVQNDSESCMNNLLVELAEKLSVLSRLEYDFIITFSAGQAIRKAEQKLSDLLHCATKLEVSCKKAWRNRMIETGKMEYALDSKGREKDSTFEKNKDQELSFEHNSAWLSE